MPIKENLKVLRKLISQNVLLSDGLIFDFFFFCELKEEAEGKSGLGGQFTTDDFKALETWCCLVIHG